ncbi:virulence-associated e family protein [Lasius niger]|uniref:Virulence-associated e family protein n=1 Tax=Lasius niger TaxID=67767 RepID=A0A0J7L464_LASNI|nr:virulence-associated e family protein [Lasius niger]
MKLYGASLLQWQRWRTLAAQDLLPIVTDPSAIPDYDPRKDGKMPSFMQAGRFTGLSGWPSYVRTTEDLDRWSADRRLSIGVQCRNLRFIDLDIPDEAAAVKVQDFVGDQLDAELPLRYRDGTGSSALVYRIADSPAVLGKGVIRLANSGGKIEFLGDGQQILVDGYHPRGVIKWDALPAGAESIPVFAMQKIADLFAALAARFGDAAAAKNWRYDKAALIRDSSVKPGEDAFAAYLHEQGLVLDTAEDGKLYIECPFCKELDGTTEVSKTSAVYMPEGYNGVATGGWRCMKERHDSTLTDLQAKVGYLSTMFPAIDEQGAKDVYTANSRPRFEVAKNGRIQPHLKNIIDAFRWDAGIGYKVYYDSFLDTVLLLDHGTGGTKVMQDEDIMRLREALIIKGFDPSVGDAEVRRVVHYVAKDNQLDSALDWAQQFDWDKRDRFTEFTEKCLQIETTAYHRAVAEYIWTALAGRVLEPGIQADMVPVFVGAQGQQKTKLIRTLVPHEQMFQEISLIGLAFREAELARQLRGVLTVEWSELKGINTSEAEVIKSWVTRKKETWTPKYKEYATDALRRFVVFGTSNHHQFLTDPTGSRRYLPVTITTNGIDLDWLDRNRDQLWAQGVAQFRRSGIAWQQAQALAVEHNSRYVKWDVWRHPVQQWLAAQAANGVLAHSMTRLLAETVGLTAARQKPVDVYRMRDLMHMLGWRENENGLWFSNDLV